MSYRKSSLCYEVIWRCHVRYDLFRGGDDGPGLIDIVWIVENGFLAFFAVVVKRFIKRRRI